MINDKEQKRSTPPQALVAIYHPEFRQGYQNGRQHCFQEKRILTDKELVACLQSVFAENVYGKGEEREGYVYYTVGFLLGQMSGCVLPCQPHEDKTEEVQKVFLDRVRASHGAAGQALVDAIQQLWTVQDQLAQTLDTDVFDQVLSRGAPMKCL